MRKIEITEEQKDHLCNELVELVKQFKKNSDLECIYYMPYQGYGKTPNNVLYMVLVYSDDCDINQIQKIEQSLNGIYGKQSYIDYLGLKIHLEMDLSYHYKLIHHYPSQVMSAKKLFNSIILLDQTGKYTQIRRNAKKNLLQEDSPQYGYFETTASVVPPFANNILSKIQKGRIYDGQKVIIHFPSPKILQYKINGGG